MLLEPHTSFDVYTEPYQSGIFRTIRSPRYGPRNRVNYRRLHLDPLPVPKWDGVGCKKVFGEWLEQRGVRRGSEMEESRG